MAMQRWLSITILTVLSGCSGAGSTTADVSQTPADTEVQAAEVARPEPKVQRVAFNGSVSLWGEVPGSVAIAPTNASDNLWQVSFAREGADFDLAVAPAGEQIVFASTRHRTTADLYIKHVKGQTITQFTNDAANDVMPAWSPDGSSIVFCSDRAGSFDLYLQKLDGGQPVQLTNSSTPELHPSFSPDGREIVFCSLSQTGVWEMQVIEVANPIRRRILGQGLFPSFSPNGDKVVFQRPRYRGTRLFSIWTIDYVDGEALRPTEIAAADNAAVINPCWSPDGRRLTFSTVLNPSNSPTERPDVADLWVVNIDGTGRVKLTNDTFANLQPDWGRDGAIYFVSNRSGFDNIWALRPADTSLIAQPNIEPVGEPQAEVPTP